MHPTAKTSSKSNKTDVTVYLPEEYEGDNFVPLQLDNGNRLRDVVCNTRIYKILLVTSATALLICSMLLGGATFMRKYTNDFRLAGDRIHMAEGQLKDMRKQLSELQVKVHDEPINESPSTLREKLLKAIEQKPIERGTANQAKGMASAEQINDKDETNDKDDISLKNLQTMTFREERIENSEIPPDKPVVIDDSVALKSILGPKGQLGERKVFLPVPGSLGRVSTIPSFVNKDITDYYNQPDYDKDDKSDETFDDTGSEVDIKTDWQDAMDVLQEMRKNRQNDEARAQQEAEYINIVDSWLHQPDTGE